MKIRILVIVLATALFACEQNNSTETTDNEVTPDKLIKNLGEQLDRGFEKNVQFIPDCDPKEYTTTVYSRSLVTNCATITNNEKKDMSDSLITKGKRSANSICSLNQQCPNGKLLRYKFDRIICDRRLWEVDLSWDFNCVQ